MKRVIRMFTPLSCPVCDSRVHRDGPTYVCLTCYAVIDVDQGAWRYPLESEFKWRLPGALGSGFARADEGPPKGAA